MYMLCTVCLLWVFESFCGIPVLYHVLSQIMLLVYIQVASNIQGDSVARGPKLLSIKNYVIEIMTWKFLYTYRERCKTGPAHNRCWNWSPFTSKHTWMCLSKFLNTFSKVLTLTAWISWRIASLSCSIVRGVFLYTLPLNSPQRKKSAGVRSGDLDGQRFFEIILSWKKLSIPRMLAFEVWHVAPSCW